VKVKDSKLNVGLISIIIPMYNRPYLIKSIWQNLSKQCYTNFEIIFVDDGSEIPIKVPSYFDLNYNLIRYEVNRGAGYARKKGREQALGEFITYLDSDDLWSENFLLECVSDLVNNPNVGMVYANTISYFDGIEKNRRVTDHQPNQILPIIFQNKKRFWATGSCLWRAEVSKPNNWKLLRNNEDFIHDIVASTINNRIRYNTSAFLFNIKSAENRTPRNASDVKRALFELRNINNLSNFNGITIFILRRMYDHKIKFEFISIFGFLRLIAKDLKIYTLDFYKYSFYFIYLNFFDGGSSKLKIYFNI
jgi:glycosyltransferase involved in cell wall biosynthesis